MELDGKIHERQKDYDEMRTHIINKLGIKVIRFTNEELKTDLFEVISRLKEHLYKILLNLPLSFQERGPRGEFIKEFKCSANRKK